MNVGVPHPCRSAESATESDCDCELASEPEPALEPELEIRLGVARSGAATLTLGGRAIDGRYEPERDVRAHAARILGEAQASGAEAILLLGAGLGRLPACLRAQSAMPVVVWEPFGGVRRALAAAHPCEAASSRADLERALAALDVGSIQLAVHPGYADLTNFEQRFALRALRRRLARVAGREAAGEPTVVSRRALDALRRLPRLRPIEALGQEVLGGQTAIVASGGPSLDAILPALRARRGGVLFAAPQALERLLDAKVEIDFVVNPDPADLLTPVLGATEAPFGALLADTSSHPSVLDRCPERTLLFHLSSPQVHGRAWEAAGLPVVDELLVTVSETCFWIARMLGAERILLAGVDYAGVDPRYGGPFRARSASGAWCSTNAAYFHGARQLAHAIAKGRLIEVRRIGDGVRVPGAEPIESAAVGDWLGGAQPRTFPRCERYAPCAPLARAVERLLGGEVPAPGTAMTPPVYPWIDFLPLAPAELDAEWRAIRCELASGSAAGRPM